MEWDTKSRGKLQLKSGGHCGRKSKEANPLQRLRAREQTHCTKKQKYPQGCSAVRAVRDEPELSQGVATPLGGPRKSSRQVTND